MKKLTSLHFTALLISITIAGISHAQAPSDAASESSQVTAPAGVDNSRLNQRDRDGTSPTPADQPENRSDVKIEAAVRQAIVHDKSLSTNAHNVKIITQAGVVTLRGPVRDSAEQQTVVSLAQQVPGVTQVQNQLDVNRP